MYPTQLANLLSKPVKVTWLDSSGMEGWTWRPPRTIRSKFITSYGVLTHAEEEFITVTPHKGPRDSDDDFQHLGTATIPASAVAGIWPMTERECVYDAGLTWQESGWIKRAEPGT